MRPVVDTLGKRKGQYVHMLGQPEGKVGDVARTIKNRLDTLAHAKFDTN